MTGLVEYDSYKTLCVYTHSHVQLFATPWTIAYQGPLFMEFSRCKYWNGLLFPSPRGSSQPRDQTWICCLSCIGRRILYHCTSWEAHKTATSNLWFPEIISYVSRLAHLATVKEMPSNWTRSNWTADSSTLYKTAGRRVSERVFRWPRDMFKHLVHAWA